MKKFCQLIHLLIFFWLLATRAGAQSPCGFDQVLQDILQSDPAAATRISKTEKQVRKLLEDPYPATKSPETITIPVVVHVVYADPAAAHNISDDQILSAIQRLNELYADTTGNSVNTNISFCLASRDPQCNPTNGIDRIDGSVVPDYATEGIDIESVDSDGKGANRLAVLNLSRWNPAEYLNIWVVNEISDNNGEAGIQAFATLPGSSFLYDGIVVLYNAFGYDYANCSCFALKSYTDENKVLAHEAGHYLGLYHTFEGDQGGSTCPGNSGTDGDKVTDTPAHKRTFFCDTGINNCYDPSDPFADMEKIIHNYMGYAPESCQYEFTQGQAERMRASLEAGRYALIHAQSCQTAMADTLAAVDCTPQTVSGTGAEYGMGILEVQIGPLIAGSGTTFQDGGYLENSCQAATFAPNTTYEISITTAGFSNEDIRVFIDYDGSGTLDPNELIFSSNNNFIHTGTFTTPDTALNGVPLRLRIISDHYQYTIDQACYEPQYGQVEDYTIRFPAYHTDQYERGTAVMLDGIDDYLISDVSLEIYTDPYTIEFWCKPEGDPTKCQIIYDKTMQNFSSVHFMAIWYGRMFIYQGRDLLYLDPGLNIEYGKWQHFAYSWDGQVQKLYKDGMLAGVDTVDQLIANNATFRFGSFFGTYFFFNGTIDNCRIWPVVRSPEQIRENMFLSRNAIDSEAIFFTFNDSDTSLAISDLSGNYAIEKYGNPQVVPSSANTGYDGSVSSIDSINTPGTYEFTGTGLSVAFTSISATSGFTVTKTGFTPNTLDGLVFSELPDPYPWIITQSAAHPFTANLLFSIPGYDFSGSTPTEFGLYYRKPGSDSTWTLLTASASQITGETISFEGIQSTGQFIVVKL